MSDMVSKELSPSSKGLSESRECLMEVYIDNQCLVIIIYEVYFQSSVQLIYTTAIIALS